MSPRLASPLIASCRLDCEGCGNLTEHRQHRAGLARDGRERLRWRCVPCHAAEALASYHRKRPTP